MVPTLARWLVVGALLLGACDQSRRNASDSGAENVSGGARGNRVALFPLKVEGADCDPGAAAGLECFLVQVENIGAVAGAGSCELFWTDVDDNIVGEAVPFNVPSLEPGERIERLVEIEPLGDEAHEASAACQPGPVI